MRQDGVFLILDELALFAGNARVFGLADLVERLAKALHHSMIKPPQLPTRNRTCPKLMTVAYL